MKALRFRYSPLRLAAIKILGAIHPDLYATPLSPLKLEELPIPKLPSTDWVRVRTNMAGICGSDLKQVLLRGDRDNPLTALISFPHVLGHEAVGVIEEVGAQVRQRQPGERVVINPWLTCLPRGIDPPCPACRAGDFPLCRNLHQGKLMPAMHLGTSSQVPGAFSEYFVCHEAQCFPIPKLVSDEIAVLADPFCVSLHAVLHNPPPSDTPILVFGLGTIGLLTIAALHSVFPQAKIYALGRYPHQVEQAMALGAQQVFLDKPETLILRIAELLGEHPLHPWKGLPWLHDGVGIVYDTIGTPESVELALRLIRPRGRLVLAGVEAPHRFEWTLLYFKEATIVGSNSYGVEIFQGERRHAINIYLALLKQGLEVSGILTHLFPLEQWQQAFKTLMHKRTTQAIKVAFDFR